MHHPEWYQLSIKKIFEQLQTSAQGLTSQDVKKRQAELGKNIVEIEKNGGFLFIFLAQFSNIFLIILLIAGCIKVLIQEYTDAGLVFSITIISALISSIQEWRAQKIADAIKKLIPHNALVLRDGKQVIIPSSNLIPGDVVVLFDGNRVPADGIIISNYGLQINESQLTGESAPIEKELHKEGLKGSHQLFDRKNMVFSGSMVIAGSGHFVVTSIGKETLVGEIAESSKSKEKETHLQKDLFVLGRKLMYIFVVAFSLLVFIGFFQNYPIKELIFALLSLLVSVVPEGLPIVFAVMLARASYDLALKYKVLVKHPRSAEVLGEMRVLIMDKTGTLTKNRPKVITCFLENQTVNWEKNCYKNTEHQCLTSTIALQEKKDDNIWLLGLVGSLLDESEEAEENGEIIQKGEPLLIALGKFSEELGFEKTKTHKQYPKLEELPFSSQTRLRYVAYLTEKKQILSVISGAPEELLAQLSEETKHYEEQLHKLLATGTRTIAIGYTYLKEDEEKITLATLNNAKYKFLALVGIEDEIRPEAASVVKAIEDLDVQIYIATGDHKRTACSIAAHVDIPCQNNQEKKILPVTEQLAQGNRVFSRIIPDEKVLLVKGLQDTVKTVGMIGDGINDVPALYAADVGISFGTAGTDTAREAADILLLQNTIHALPDAIIWGRHIRAAVQRVIYFLLTTAVGEVCTILLGLSFALPVPLLANQILWLHIVTDGFLDFAISMEPINKKYLTRPSPHSLFTAISAKKIFAAGIIVAAGTLWLYALSLDHSLPYARTMAFTTLTLFQWALAWNFRSLNQKPYQIGYTKNHWLLLMTMAMFAAHCIAIYFPFFQQLLRFTPLSFTDWLWCGALPMLFFIITQFHSWFAVPPEEKN